MFGVWEGFGIEHDPTRRVAPVTCPSNPPNKWPTHPVHEMVRRLLLRRRRLRRPTPPALRPCLPCRRARRRPRGPRPPQQGQGRRAALEGELEHVRVGLADGGPPQGRGWGGAGLFLRGLVLQLLPAGLAVVVCVLLLWVGGRVRRRQPTPRHPRCMTDETAHTHLPSSLPPKMRSLPSSSSSPPFPKGGTNTAVWRARTEGYLFVVVVFCCRWVGGREGDVDRQADDATSGRSFVCEGNAERKGDECRSFVTGKPKERDGTHQAGSTDSALVASGRANQYGLEELVGGGSMKLCVGGGDWSVSAPSRWRVKDRGATKAQQHVTHTTTNTQRTPAWRAPRRRGGR